MWVFLSSGIPLLGWPSTIYGHKHLLLQLILLKPQGTTSLYHALEIAPVEFSAWEDGEGKCLPEETITFVMELKLQRKPKKKTSLTFKKSEGKPRQG